MAGTACPSREQVRMKVGGSLPRPVLVDGYARSFDRGGVLQGQINGLIKSKRLPLCGRGAEH